MIIDTDVLIWYFRGNKNALTIINNYKHYRIIQDLRVSIFKPDYNENTLE